MRGHTGNYDGLMNFALRPLLKVASRSATSTDIRSASTDENWRLLATTSTTIY